MIREITTLTQYPYTAVVHLEVTFADGSQVRGSGAVVGRNDILTATHVLYSPDAGGWATKVRVLAGVDYNSALGRYESTSLADLGSFTWQANAWPQGSFQDADNGTFTFSENQYDIALLGLSKAIGDQVGWFGLASGYDGTHWAHQIGYPAGSSGMMYSEIQVTRENGYAVYSAYGATGMHMGPGSSGGPLYVYQDNSPYIIGVKSSGSANSSHWADIGLLYDELTTLMRDNDTLLPPTIGGQQRGTLGNDVFQASVARDFIDGNGGRDTVIYNLGYGSYQVQLNASNVTVTRYADPQDSDSLSSIERLQFSDGTLALDTAAGEVAGSAYRLYQAAFDRTPDTAGLSYWISAMDRGMSLAEAASYFTKSPEFIGIYGTAPSNEQLLIGYYNNVLDRAPDASGKAYWLDKMQQGLPNSEVLAYFAESPENQIKLQGVLEDGIWLAGHYV
ncbi:DUF4214 domain-containing protein [Pseudomonas sp. NY15367]